MASPSNILSFLKTVGEGTNDLEELEEATAIGRETLLELMRELEVAGVLSVSGETVRLRAGGKVEVARLALQTGASMQELSRCLDWREFEVFVARALESCGFYTVRNLTVTKPRRQFDVVGVDGEFAIAFDCKHWGKISLGQMTAAALKQIERVEVLLSKSLLPHVLEAMPAMVVLFSPGFSTCSGVPVVPVDTVFDFVMGARGNAGEFVVLRRKEAAHTGQGRQKNLF